MDKTAGELQNFPGSRLRVVTKPHTDLWQRTYYHFRNDNAPVLQMTHGGNSTFPLWCGRNFTESHHRFDQCGVVLYLDSENWLKGSVEYENEALSASWEAL